MHSIWNDIDGLKIHTLTAGAGPQTVVLLHGGGIDSARLSWELLIDDLAEKYQVFAPDWPGFGHSSTPPIPYQIQDCVRLLDKLLDAWGVPQASLAGISLGGGITLGYTLSYPQRVQRIIPVDSYGLQRAAPFHKLSYLYVHAPLALEMTWATIRSRWMVRQALQSIFYDNRRVSAALVEQVYQEVIKTGAGKSFAAVQKHEITWQGTRTYYMDRLGEITVPTRFIHGTHDKLVPLACVQEAQSQIPGAELCTIPQCGHWPQRERPEVFNPLVKEFFGG